MFIRAVLYRVSIVRPCLPCCRAVEILDQPGQAGWSLRQLVDVGSPGQRAAVGVAQLPGDRAGGFPGRRRRRGQRVAQQVGCAAAPAAWAKARNARLVCSGRSGVSRSVRSSRSSSTGRGPGRAGPAAAAGACGGPARGGGRTARRRKGWQAQRGLAGGGLERANDQQLATATVGTRPAGRRLLVDAGQRLAEPHGAVVQIQVVPFQAAQLAGAGAGRRRQDHKGAQPRPQVTLGGGEQDADLLGGEGRRRVGGDGGWFGVGGWVGRLVVPFSSRSRAPGAGTGAAAGWCGDPARLPCRPCGRHGPAGRPLTVSSTQGSASEPAGLRSDAPAWSSVAMVLTKGATLRAAGQEHGRSLGGAAGRAKAPVPVVPRCP
jgi:hypothetical protein